MARKFNIHEWQQKHLFEQDDFTPDLEKDALQRDKIRQMMDKEKESEYELSDEEKDNLTDMANEFVRKLTDVRGGNYSGDSLLAALQFIILNIQDMEPMLYTDTDGDGIPDVVDDEGELDEQNSTGTGASVESGDGYSYSTPKWFKKKEPMKEQEDGTQEVPPEEEYEKDIEAIADHPILDKVNTVDEWVDLLQVVMDMADETQAITPAIQKAALIDLVKNLNNPE